MKTSTTYRHAAILFLRGVGLVYAVAIYSLLTQLPGLIGSNGILPIGDYLQAAREQLGDGAWLRVPTFLWWSHSDAALMIWCYAGLAFSGLLMLGIFPLISALGCWLVYLSLTVAGQAFLGFQWDNLLLEAGLIAIILAPPVKLIRRATFPPCPRWSIILVHWLLFRLMFASGYVKLASQDTSWWDLTALTYHFWTQPLPMWTAWYFNHAPLWVLKFSTALMFFIELVVPFFIFLHRYLRYLAFVLLVFLQVMIAGTGNYGFFNLLTIVLCFSLLDDRLWRQDELKEAPVSNRRMRWVMAGFRWPVAALIMLVSVFSFAKMLMPSMPTPAAVSAVEHTVAPFRSINQYGLFASMTKTRPEIIIEGSYDGKNWTAYEFKWKPGDIYRTPIFVAPHMPRLDWQMWFAALGSYQRNPWFMNLMVRLMEGSPEVISLLDANPFKAEPPVHIRALYYEYTFSTKEQYAADYRWWSRELKGLYCPTLVRRP